MKKLLLYILILFLFSSCASLVEFLNPPDDVHELIEKQASDSLYNAQHPVEFKIPRYYYY